MKKTQIKTDKTSVFFQKLLFSLSSEIKALYKKRPYDAVRDKRLKTVANKKIEVVICIHNALPYVEQCLDSILKYHDTPNEHITLIDDGSDDKTAEYLRKFVQENNSFINLIRHNKPLGYTKSANEGLRNSDADLTILLNSDTIVTENWSRKMADAVFSVQGAGAVGPMSNAASVQSLPDIAPHNGQTAINILPKNLSLKEMNILCEKMSDSDFILQVPMLHGFCLGITKECINKLKGFDEEHFPTGFGEENDFCMRALKAGFSMVLATHTFIYHAKTKSFDEDVRKKLCEQGNKNLFALHGKEMLSKSYSFMQINPVLHKMRDIVKIVFDFYNNSEQSENFYSVPKEIKFNKSISFKKIGCGFASNVINTLPFRKNALTTYFTKLGRKIQFVAYYEPTGRIIVAKKEFGIWKMFNTQFFNDLSDAHNSISIEVDGCGFIHLIWCQHNGKISYARSKKALKPDFIECQILGKNEEMVTYPEFYKQPSGDLLLLYRYGYSGNGVLILNRYSCKEKTWKRLFDRLIDGCGSESPYWQACVDKKGRLHISWCWRKNRDVSSNHDICYMRSYNDSCAQFTDSSGKFLNLPQTPLNTKPFYVIPPKSSLINQTSMTTDENNIPYIATFFENHGVLQYVIFHNDGITWQMIDARLRKTREILEGAGTQSLPCARPQIAVHKNTIFLLLRDKEFDNKLILAKIKNITQKITTDIMILTDDPLGEYEPMYDEELWRKKHKLSLFIEYSHYKNDAENTKKTFAENIYILNI